MEDELLLSGKLVKQLLSYQNPINLLRPFNSAFLLEPPWSTKEPVVHSSLIQCVHAMKLQFTARKALQHARHHISTLQVSTKLNC